MRKRKTKYEVQNRFLKLGRKRKTKSKIQICFSMSCENEKWKWNLNSLFPCHRKTVGIKVHAFFSRWCELDTRTSLFALILQRAETVGIASHGGPRLGSSLSRDSLFWNEKGKRQCRLLIFDVIFVILSEHGKRFVITCFGGTLLVSWY